MRDNRCSVNLSKRRPHGGTGLQALRLAAAGEPTAHEGHWMAGFIDAEGSFHIGPRNGGSSWFCALQVAQRADDAQILVQLQRLTGAGRLYPIKAHGNSNPQVAWSVANEHGCARIVDLLERFPLNGRKQREFTVWAHAVRLLQDESTAGFRVLAERLRALRRYVDPPALCLAPQQLTPALCSYLGGFFTGEGSFALSGSSARVVVKLRRDDRPLLERLAGATGLGKLCDVAASGSTRPATAWIILRHEELAAASRLLSSVGLKGRKARELEAWTRGALEFARAAAAGRRRDRQVVRSATADLQAARAYVAPPAAPPVVPLDALSPRRFYAEIITAFASEAAGPLTCTRYAAIRRDRHPEWPHRNTITHTFGSWLAALEAAGVADRAALAPDRYRAGRPRTPGEQARRDKQRRVVADAVNACGAELRRTPRATDYFAWRLDGRSEELPGQATTYRLFPQGWSSMLAAARLRKPASRGPHAATGGCRAAELAPARGARGAARNRAEASGARRASRPARPR